jgi:transketolase
VGCDARMDLDTEITVLRRRLLRMIAASGSGHPGSSLSCLHILIALYHRVLRGVPTQDDDRDRFVLSKGHAAPALYILLESVGILHLTGTDRLRQQGSRLQGHPDRLRTPGVEASSGSLGQGLSIGTGMALGLRRRNSDARVHVLLGDGELQEGQVWEAAGAAAHFRLPNLTAIVDRNRYQHDGGTEAVLSVEPLAQRWSAFGWHVSEVDGHDIRALTHSLRQRHGRPHVVIAHTRKGFGVPFMEGDSPWHSVKDTGLLRRYVMSAAEVAARA